ncbi:sodium/calcium exchanger 2a isoform X1 [Cynoglossus semilaevis]|uniref:Solute carrier family 8 member 2a n=1 Tax=Cynoglossus semilaevis TaxID=244447 RepID=A0A3P8WN01_CYNSE|nr:sodium/calcium exchanger 2-like isoform X1 [Cynoglossus semilaevis]XP_008330733.1 sodium/calcium exchanger 2-like isoform X1 [Cynoglossus semilaevis]XP_024921358.1 sodium/calcium exchanger 2-like isoform X1 [Cynoglossus semilaevis]XP_024921359.1 sodium/calcium exchanger 2-like isoform X1 [Cynoglossus semilaevis]XP_024921360.1 sodium/calcium exchanger 2-like isoform X1 [Cynoglossus semilaevis]XP_024921361.1 sodium/calcium exchanger 2-like isoform X1 [Cynoglossus semilaevis]XP_024921363.1 so
MEPLPVHLLSLSVLLMSLLLMVHPCTSYRVPIMERASGPDPPQPTGNSSGKRSCTDAVVCKPGILLPVWLPLNPPLGEQAGRAIIYFLCLLYIFMGVSIIADRFMASIEVITSQEKKVTITNSNGEKTETTVRIWNETVSNLTLMALGSSAPEILLSIIEVCGHNFHAGELGPSTIVGSAAFNMFVIIGVCVSVIPDGESRKIKHLRVFFITSFWSIFAYIWLYLILAVISPGIVEVWEGIVTLLYFPVCVLLAWIADRRLLFYKYMHKRYRADKRHGIVVEMEGDLAPKGIDVIMDGKMSDSGAGPENSTATVSVQTGKELEQDKEEVVRILKDLKQKHPDKDLDQLIEMANYSTLVHQKKSRAFYRVQATRMLIGAGNILKKHAADHTRRAGGQGTDKATCSHICFESAQYQCTENCGSLSLGVILDGGTGQNTFYVDYCTENGSANAGADYEFTEGTLVFKPGETHKEIKVGILDDDIFEEDEHFFVRLCKLRTEEGGNEGTGNPPKGRLVEPMTATITILDDDHAGIFTFGQQVLRVGENTGTLTVTVVRNSGSRGTVAVPYHTEDGTGRAGVDYEETRGELEFTNEQTSQTLQVHILNVAEYEKQENFFIVLEDPKWLKRGLSALLLNQGNPSPEEEEARRISEMGKPILGEHRKLEVIIEESCEFKSTVDKLLKDTNLAAVLGTHSWREQFIEAVTVSAGNGDEEEGQEQRMPNCFDYFMHILCIFWKILFAFVPPTQYWNGWACFIVSICVIGFLTALIGDLASHFGCTVGLRDAVTAVVFVALGTSLPDTFASKVAATQDQYADASIGNVTGSNAVNVFLGIGVAWSVAAVYWEVKGKVFRVEPGSLAFSVTLFTIFALFTVALLMVRRRPSIGGELGGSRVPKTLTSLLLFGLWFLYVLFSSLEVYCHIKGF